VTGPDVEPQPVGDPGAGHVPVMLDRVGDLLAPALDRSDAVVVDATLGLGGHAARLLELCPQARLIGIDRDAAALAVARERLAGFGDRVDLVHAENDALPDVLAARGIERIAAALFDLGVSSVQLDEDDRGFAYSRDVPLDMRMNPDQPFTAADLLATASQEDLARVLRVYGEERFASRIAAAIVARRATTPVRTTGELAALVYDAVPVAVRRRGTGHPAKRTFQAVRIEVNAELDVLGVALPAAIAALRVGGRVTVLAYHSLEDRLVKRAFADLAQPAVPHGVPVVPEAYQPTLRLLTRGAEKATETEIATNPRARSVRLRAAERIKEAA